MSNKFEGLTREEVAFSLNSKFEASYAGNMLYQYRQNIYEEEVEVIYNRKAPLMDYLKFDNGVWHTSDELGKAHTLLKIWDLVPFLRYLGYNNDSFKKASEEIDEIRRESESGNYRNKYTRKR